VAEGRFLTVADVAELLQVDEQTVRRWIRERKLAAHRFGGKAGYRIQRKDLEAFLATTREGDPTEGKVAA